MSDMQSHGSTGTEKQSSDAAQASATSKKPKKEYKYDRVSLSLEDGMVTTISLDIDLVAKVTKILGSRKNVIEAARKAALEYEEGKSPARTRSAHAQRALQALLIDNAHVS